MRLKLVQISAKTMAQKMGVCINSRFFQITAPELPVFISGSLGFMPSG